jgi:hypothetical protein
MCYIVTQCGHLSFNVTKLGYARASEEIIKDFCLRCFFLEASRTKSNGNLTPFQKTRQDLRSC